MFTLSLMIWDDDQEIVVDFEGENQTDNQVN